MLSVTSSRRSRQTQRELHGRAAADTVAVFPECADTEWSLTDCISFVVMDEREVTDALIGDRHFEQARFRALLA